MGGKGRRDVSTYWKRYIVLLSGLWLGMAGRAGEWEGGGRAGRAERVRAPIGGCNIAFFLKGEGGKGGKGGKSGKGGKNGKGGKERKGCGHLLEAVILYY